MKGCAYSKAKISNEKFFFLLKREQNMWDCASLWHSDHSSQAYTIRILLR